MTSDDPDYFTEFLADPSAVDLADFYDMVRKWGAYLHAHRGEFNYLEDDEWKEIRERLIEEFHKRERLKNAIEAQWEELNEIDDRADELSDAEVIEYMRRRLDFMKAHQKLYDFQAEDIADCERAFEEFVKSVKVCEISEQQARLAKIALDKSIADLDETLVGIYEKTGKIPVFPIYRDKKTYKGN